MSINPFKNPIRKVKASYIASTVIAAFLMFGIDLDSDKEKVIEEFIQALLVFIPSLISFYTKMSANDVDKVVLKK